MVIKEYFKDEELRCRCCGAINMKQDFMEQLYLARIIAGSYNIPFIINSGYRCEKHNAEVGSKYNNHPSGRAVDIACIDSRARSIIVHSLIQAKFNRIGIAHNMIHVDNMDREGQEHGMWLY